MRTLESGDGICFAIDGSLLAGSPFFRDMYDLPIAEPTSETHIVPLPGVSSTVLHFGLRCAQNSASTRRNRRSSAPLGAIDNTYHSTSHCKGPAKAQAPTLIPSSAWTWEFLDEVVALAFAYELPQALEVLAAASGDFYNPVLAYTFWSLVDAAKGGQSVGRGRRFPSSNVMPFPTTSEITYWAPALLRWEGGIGAWCVQAMQTHCPAALESLEALYDRRIEVLTEIAIEEGLIADQSRDHGRRKSSRYSDEEESFEEDDFAMRRMEANRANGWDSFVRRAGTVTSTILLRVEREDPKISRLSRRKSTKTPTKAVMCSPSCKPILKRKLTAAVGLVTRTPSSERFGTVEYFVEYTYGGIACTNCRVQMREALTWVWCMKAPWRGGVGV